MIFKSIKNLFEPKAVDKRLWDVMEKMDPLLSYKRFRALKLTKQQRPIVQGLIDGTIAPNSLDAVRAWAEQEGERNTGIGALVFALQYVLESPDVTYLFKSQEAFPIARFPKYVDDESLTVIFNDRESHLQITSLKELVSSNEISDYVLESLSFSQFLTRMESRARRYHGASESSATNDRSATKGEEEPGT